MSKMIKVTDEVGGELERRAKADNTSVAGEIKKLLDTPDTSDKDYLKQVGRAELVELISQRIFPELPLSSQSIPQLVDGWRETLKGLSDEELEKEYNSFFASGQIYEQYEDADAVLTSRWVISRNRICVIEYANRVPIINLTDYVLDRLVALGELV